ncbi:glycosyltransferase family 2 protein [Rhodococcus triatomae]
MTATTIELRPGIDSARIPDGPVSPPDDSELYAYLGPQRRWVQVCMTVAFGLAALSLARFATTSVWLWPLLVVLAVNICGSVISALSGWNRRRISADSHRRTTVTWAQENPVGPSVDVFLPTCGEDLEVLLNTYRHVEKMYWSGELTVWVLDDADRPEVAAEARAHGFRYLVRPNRGHMKKAGNLQHAYDNTDGEFIVVLDADFCPRPDFLDHLVPYMDDPKVGIVQSPQYFDTTPSMNWLERTAGATQELFYRWVQPSRDAAGAPICVGTCAVYRRAALAVTGGFAQIEHSEDVHTGIFLLRAGFATQYVPILVSKGLCPSDTAGFLNQQYRWCNGSITLLRSGNAHRHPLTLRQRICFWAGFMYYISTAVNVFAIHVPGVIMAVFFPLEVRAAHFVPFLAGAWVYFVLLPRVSNSRWRFEVMRVQMAYSFCHALAITHKLTGRTKGWVATGAVGKKSSLARTVSILGSVTIVVGLVASWGAWGYDVVHYGIAEFWMMAIFLLGYTYLSVPLLTAFLRTLGAVGPTSRPAARAVAAAENRITGYEAVAYTLVIVLLAVVALGGFDLMLPWL